MQTQGFEIPTGIRPAMLHTATAEQTTLLPNTIVLCINRGNKVLKDTWDGQHVEIKPGYFETEFGAAVHFQKRLIVPGTRNLEVGGHVSFIGILGSADGRVKRDDPELCQPFSDAENLEMGQKIEAIDRGGEKMQVQRIAGSMAGRGLVGALTSGTARGTQISADIQGTAAAEAAAAEVFTPPATSDTREAEAEAGRTPQRRRGH